MRSGGARSGRRLLLCLGVALGAVHVVGADAQEPEVALCGDDTVYVTGPPEMLLAGRRWEMSWQGQSVDPTDADSDEYRFSHAKLTLTPTNGPSRTISYPPRDGSGYRLISVTTDTEPLDVTLTGRVTDPTDFSVCTYERSWRVYVGKRRYPRVASIVEFRGTSKLRFGRSEDCGVLDGRPLTVSLTGGGQRQTRRLSWACGRWQGRDWRDMPGLGIVNGSGFGQRAADLSLYADRTRGPRRGFTYQLTIAGAGRVTRRTIRVVAGPQPSLQVD